jgi:hypothetical protein
MLAAEMRTKCILHFSMYELESTYLGCFQMKTQNTVTRTE